MENEKAKELRNILEGAKFSEIQLRDVWFSMERFGEWKADRALNALFTMNVRNQYTAHNLEEMGLLGLPEEAFLLVSEALKEKWEEGSSFMEELKLPQMCGKVQQAFHALMKECMERYPDKDAEIITIHIYRRLIWYMKIAPQCVEREVSWLERSKLGALKELRYFGSETDVLLPLTPKMAVLLKEMSKMQREEEAEAEVEGITQKQVEKANKKLDAIYRMVEEFSQMPGGFPLQITIKEE